MTHYLSRYANFNTVEVMDTAAHHMTTPTEIL